MILKDVNQLMMKLADKKTAASKVTSTRKSELELAVAASQSFTRYSREILNRGNPSDVTRAYNDLHKRASELLKRDLNAGNCYLTEVGVSVNVLFDKLAKFILGNSNGG
jgi:hypothetical protein